MKTLITVILSLFISSFVMAQPGKTIIPQKRIKKDQYHNKPINEFGLGFSADDIKKSSAPSPEVLKKLIERGLFNNKTAVTASPNKNLRKKSSSPGKQNLDSIISEYFDQEEQMWMDDYKIHYTYNSDGNQLTYVYFEKDSVTGEWVDTYKDQYEYDSNANQILYISYSRDSQSDEWLAEYKEESAFDSQNNQTLMAVYYKESMAGEWMGSYKHESEFDSDGNLTLYINYSWDYIENTWIGSNKLEYVYENGVKKFDREFIWDPESNGWQSQGVLTYEYIDDLLASIIASGMDNNWDGEINNLDLFKTGFFYDAQGNLTSEINYENNDEIIAWEAIDKTEHTYNASQELETSVLYFLFEGEWIIYYMYSYTFDPNGNMPSITMLFTDGSDWLPAYKDLYHFDSTGNLTLHLTSYYDFENDVWEDEVREEYLYDTRGNIISAIFYDYGAYKTELSYNNSYSFEELNIPNEFPVQYFNHMLTELIEYDLIDDLWVATYRSKIFYSENNSTGIPDITVPGIKVFPNPASAFVTFQGNFLPEGTSVEFFDFYGKKVKSDLLPANGQVPVHQLAAGIYFYELRGKSLNQRGKIIVN